MFLVLHVFRVYLTGGFKKPREFTWLTGIVLAVITVSFGVTGYSLPFTIKLGIGPFVTGVPDALPFVGPILVGLPVSWPYLGTAALRYSWLSSRGIFHDGGTWHIATAPCMRSMQVTMKISPRSTG
jgi:quinol-cytochrome oxidoreductase complex cytochrome b subunit